LHNLLER